VRIGGDTARQCRATLDFFSGNSAGASSRQLSIGRVDQVAVLDKMYTTIRAVHRRTLRPAIVCSEIGGDNFRTGRARKRRGIHSAGKSPQGWYRIKTMGCGQDCRWPSSVLGSNKTGEPTLPGQRRTATAVGGMLNQAAL
jgi:hypothetical protein